MPGALFSGSTAWHTRAEDAAADRAMNQLVCSAISTALRSDSQIDPNVQQALDSFFNSIFQTNRITAHPRDMSSGFAAFYYPQTSALACGFTVVDAANVRQSIRDQSCDCQLRTAREPDSLL